ncbi:nuclear transport factor 2 family protein [Streptomyces sp. NBC_01012]|uniref:Nuclear transport factor 2 family protein n=1 Tax=Streptomyces sp. NBC_01401 TaxID=2903854 RepID=A0AAU3GXY4_9ACTN|nr:nuclear transport factor 2 family protein [Streptomyces sp. NBC_01012]
MSQNLKDKVITYLRALEKSDWKSARALCTETATVWHNDGKGDETFEEYFEGLRRQIGSYESIRYDILRQLSQPDEVLQQHVVHVTANDGKRGEVHAAVHFGFDGTGLITRIEAYANYIPVSQHH